MHLPHLNRTSISKGVLVYLPHKRYEFYGLQYIERLVEDFQDVTFYIVADELHRLAHFRNVRSLGWVSEMEPVWELVGLGVRITEHDGYPRTVLEALARGKYVVHNRAFDGCWFASNYEEIRNCIVDFKQIKSINDTGLATEKQLLSGKSDLELIDHYINDFKKHQFMIENHKIVGLPTWLREQEIDKAIEEMIAQLQEKESIDLRILRDALAKDISCKGSIKANHHINQAEVDQLMIDLRACKNPYYCPHGRPTIIKLSHYDVERMFKRVV